MCIHTDTDLPGQLGRNQWRWVIKGVSFHEEESEHMLSPEDIYPAVKPQKVIGFFQRINICTRCRKDTVLQVRLMQQQSDSTHHTAIPQTNTNPICFASNNVCLKEIAQKTQRKHKHCFASCW